MAVARDIKALTALEQSIRDAGVPIDGLRVSDTGAVTVQFCPEATAPQKQQAQQIVNGWDWDADYSNPIQDATADQKVQAIAVYVFLAEHFPAKSRSERIAMMNAQEQQIVTAALQAMASRFQ